MDEDVVMKLSRERDTLLVALLGLVGVIERRDELTVICDRRVADELGRQLEAAHIAIARAESVG